MQEKIIGLSFVLCGIIVNQLEAIFVKRYGQKHGKGGMFFNAIICLFATIYFFVTDKGGLHFPKEILIYGLINSAMYAVGFYTVYIAFKTGSFGLTRLFTSFGVIISTFYGIIFLKEPTSIFTYIALGMIFVSLFLVNYQRNEKKAQKISIIWVLCVLFNVISGSAIAIIGRMQFGIFGDAYKNEFLILSLGGAALYLLILGVLFEKNSFRTTIKYGALYGAAAGIFNGIANLITLVVYNYLPISFMTPFRSGLGLVINFLVSVLFYKEKLSKCQLVSVAIGVAAVVLMNF